VRLHVKVVPGASRDEVVGLMGDTLKVRVIAAPERGKANAAVERTIAAALGLPSGNVRIVAGHTSPRKIVEIDADETDVLKRLR
jgi:uncharacterized protein (TIGR00251 family)